MFEEHNCDTLVISKNPYHFFCFFTFLKLKNANFSSGLKFWPKFEFFSNCALFVMVPRNVKILTLLVHKLNLMEQFFLFDQIIGESNYEKKRHFRRNKIFWIKPFFFSQPARYNNNEWFDLLLTRWFDTGIYFLSYAGLDFQVCPNLLRLKKTDCAIRI